MFLYGKDHLTAGKALQILRGQLPAQLDRETREKIDHNHRELMAIAQGEQAVYGVNTGFGPLCNTVVDKEETSDLQRNLLLSHSVGVGRARSQRGCGHVGCKNGCPIRRVDKPSGKSGIQVGRTFRPVDLVVV